MNTRNRIHFEDAAAWVLADVGSRPAELRRRVSRARRQWESTPSQNRRQKAVRIQKFELSDGLCTHQSIVDEERDLEKPVTN
jgi:hypothetical protein